MRLKYDSKKPRRIEVVVYQDDVLDVPKHIGDTLVRVTGFKKTTSKNDPTPLEQLEAFADAVAAAEDDDRHELVNALIATTQALTEIEFIVGTVEEIGSEADGDDEGDGSGDAGDDDNSEES